VANIKFLEPLVSYLQHCETHCVAGCCGLDAFDFSPGHALGWLDEVGSMVIQDAIHQIDVLAASNQSIASDQLNVALNPAEASAFYAEIRASLVATSK
jgi:Family of unknown function (DUF6331)